LSNSLFVPVIDKGGYRLLPLTCASSNLAFPAILLASRTNAAFFIAPNNNADKPEGSDEPAIHGENHSW
jgi:hypothetical protein